MLKPVARGHGKSKQKPSKDDESFMKIPKEVQMERTYYIFVGKSVN